MAQTMGKRQAQAAGKDCMLNRAEFPKKVSATVCMHRYNETMNAKQTNHRMRRGLLNWSLREVLMLFLCVSLLLTGVLMGLSRLVYQRTLAENTRLNMELYASEQQKILADGMQSIKTALAALASKMEITDYLQNNRGYKAANVSYIVPSLSDICRYVPTIEDIALVASNGAICAMTSNNMDIENLFIRENVVRAYCEDMVNSLATYTFPVETSRQTVLAMVLPVQDALRTGFVVAFCSWDSLLRNLGFDDRQYVVFQDDVVICKSAQDLPDENLLLECIAKRENCEQWAYLRVAQTDWDVFVEYPLLLNSAPESPGMRQSNAAALVIFAFVECLLIFAIQRTIVRPVASIAEQSARISNLGGTLDNPTPARYELTNLVNNVNDMVLRINQMSEEISATRLRMLEMDIAHLKEHNMFLQAQINPHFLYNMLECICGMASEAGNANIREAAQALAKMYQYCLRAPESTLGEELECIALFERLMRLRYDDLYQIDLDIPEDLLILPMPRMILEPLVENAMQHGFLHGLAKVFVVRICAEFQDGTLTLRVCDNGSGMREEALEELNRVLQSPPEEPNKSGTRIGLRNVAARLHLLYNAASSLVLCKNEAGGITVEMKIQYVDKEEWT